MCVFNAHVFILVVVEAYHFMLSHNAQHIHIFGQNAIIKTLIELIRKKLPFLMRAMPNHKMRFVLLCLCSV